jgi:ferrous iron transport protein B
MQSNGVNQVPEQSVNHQNGHSGPQGRHRHGHHHDRHFTIAMAGNANVGKSSIFNQLTGLAQETGNWSGKTVGITEGILQHHHQEIHITDLPGIYSFSTYSPEEIYTREYIFNTHPDVVINVVDATSLERNLFLTLQLKEMGVPVVIALNNSDVAEKKHINLDTPLLGKIMGAPVVKTIAIKGIGVHELIDEALSLKNRTDEPENTLKYGREIENRIEQIIPALDKAVLKYPARWTAIQLMQGEKDLFEVENEATSAVTALAQKMANEITAIHGEDITTVMAAERYALAASIAKQVNIQPEVTNRTLSKLDTIVLHPVFGYISFFIVMGAILAFISVFGGWITNLITNLFESFKPSITSQLIDILWNGGTVGFYAALSVGIGFILPFFYILSWLSESGYFPRIAFIMDRPCHMVGLHGQASLPLVMGFGCSVPACMACRIMDNKRDRMIATLLTTLVPCSARTSVVLGLVGAFIGWYWAIALLVFQFLLIFVIGRILNKLIPSRSPGIIMEMPEYRFPSWKIVWSQTWYKFKDFITIGVPLIVAGSMVIESLRVFGWLGQVTDFLSPVTVTWLGLPAFTGVLLIFGILRKEANLALLMSYAGGAAITSVISPLQMVVFSIVILLYIPCISTIAVLFRENGRKVTATIVLGEIGLAIFIGGIAYRLLGLVM